MECPRDKSQIQGHLSWMRLVSGNFPEFLANMPIYDVNESKLWSSNSKSRITAKQEPGMFVLEIRHVQKSDMAVYYCVSWNWVQKMTFVNGIFLQVKDSPEAEPSVFPDLRSDTGPAGSPVTFRCSVFSRPHNKTCTDGHDVFWFRAATDVAHPSFVYAREDCGEVESGSVQKCVHGFSKDVGSSEAGTYSCAVAACGQIFVTTAKTIIKEDSSKCSLHGFVIIIMSVALVISFIVSGFLIFKIKTKICFCFQARPQTSDETRRDEDALVYSVPTVVRKSGKVRQTNEEFSTYTDVRLHES
ncbi:uncharacterized protein LOC133508713 isoform X2 [Syngnathoides biaculeatus]|uniref:uncharacterized protein LOC133508713 isoform X2 n=1 Tax=Syngnathoides biaculeatus TaxID=300417 RepID=UPI002ADE22C1|nr:uncharacterized protein LOC133508713 isoform X2 [Syngnathoides biaculeatus]